MGYVMTLGRIHNVCRVSTNGIALRAIRVAFLIRWDVCVVGVEGIVHRFWKLCVEVSGRPALLHDIAEDL